MFGRRKKPSSTRTSIHSYSPRLESLETREVPAALLQVIHNSPYAAAAVVDVYINGTKVLNDVKYTQASSYLAVDSGKSLTIDIVGGADANNSKPVFTTSANFTDNSKNIAIATGDPSKSSGATKFFLDVFTNARNTASTATKTELLVYHGSPDAPTVDVKLRGTGTIDNDLAYPSFSSDGYVSIAPANIVIDITKADGITAIGSFKADLSSAAGKSVTVLATGFVTPPSGSTNKFGLLAVFADGTTSIVPTTTSSEAKLQIIHNSPYSAAKVVDVYINDTKILDNLAYTKATGFLSVPSGENLKIDIVGGSETTNAKPMFTTTTKLTEGKGIIAAAVGDPSKTSGSTKFNLLTTDIGRTTASASDKVDLLVLHGSPDAPTVDINGRNIGTLVNDISFANFDTTYRSVAPGVLGVDVRLANGISPVGSFTADVSTNNGTAVVIAATGLLTPGTNDGKFGLLAVFADGKTVVLLTTSRFASNSFTVGGKSEALSFGIGDTKGTKVDLVFSGADSPEFRTATGDVNGDGVEDFVIAAGPTTTGSSSFVVRDGKTGKDLFSSTPYESTYRGGLNVSVGDLNGDGQAEVVISADQSGGPRVTIFNPATSFGKLADFFGIDDKNFRGGARTAIGDVNGDGVGDLTVAAGFGGGPRVAVFNGKSLPGNNPARLFNDFFVFEQTLRNGVFVASGDVNADGKADLITGGGPGGGPRVFGLSGADLVSSGASKQTIVTNFFAGPTTTRNGVRVSVKDLDGDYKGDIVVGLGGSGVAQVRTFLGKNLADANPLPSSELNPVGSSNTTVFVG